MNTWCVLPVRSLAESKSRLAHILTAEERGALTGRFVQHTIATLKEVAGIDHIMVVSRDPDVFDLVSTLGVVILPEQGTPGLNEAVSQASRAVKAMGAERLLVLPADLPFLSQQDIQALFDRSEVGTLVIASDEVGDGTNAMLVAPADGIAFAYGVGSFERHKRLAEDRGLQVVIVQRHGLAFDLDTEVDWQAFQAQLDRR